VLAALTITLLAATARDIGVTWDEPVYMEASELYVSWLGELVSRPGYALSDSGIRTYWALNHEHPPFDKLWSGLIWSVSRNWVDHLTAHRLGNIILSGGLIALLYLMVAGGYGRVAGLVAAGALLTMPRFFFHAHLASLGVPTTATIFLVTFLFWRALDRPQVRWSLWLGIPFGLALATKINGLVELPILLGSWSLLYRRQRYVLFRLGLMGLFGVLVWLMLWPWLYYDTLNRLTGYVSFMTTNHYQIAQYYRGHLYTPPPWHFPFAMTLMVVPLTLTLLAAVGSVHVLVGRRKQALGGLFVLGSLIPLLILAIGKAQVFDNDRLLMPAFPFVAGLAGIGFSQVALGIRTLAQQSGREQWARPAMLILVALLFVPHIALASKLYPHLLSYYSETVSGLSGARRLGMETTYWAETYAEALPYLNSHAPRGAMVWVEAHDVMLYYQAHGMLRSDLRIASEFGNEAIVKGTQGYQATINDADMAVIEYREAGFTPEVTDWLRDRKLIYELKHDAIPLMGIYTH
jgi:4-amino-4-deoxy-L-arabinose transferase-like glycosyltransferase